MKNKLSILFFLSSFYALAQEFTIKHVELSGDDVNIYYDLVDSVSNRVYTISLYSSKDNFVSRLEKVGGDIGLEIKPGGNHKITWNAKSELGTDFIGKIGLEVRGRLYIPFVRLDGLNKIYKRGKAYPITWTGGTQQNILNFDLYKGDHRVYPFSNIANVGQTKLSLPTSIKPGKGYYFKITDSKNKDQIVNSLPFSIKRKTPLLVKILPVLAIGGAAYVLTTSASKDTESIVDPSLPPARN